MAQWEEQGRRSLGDWLVALPTLGKGPPRTHTHMRKTLGAEAAAAPRAPGASVCSSSSSSWSCPPESSLGPEPANLCVSFARQSPVSGPLDPLVGYQAPPYTALGPPPPHRTVCLTTTHQARLGQFVSRGSLGVPDCASSTLGLLLPNHNPASAQLWSWHLTSSIPLDPQ